MFTYICQAVVNNSLVEYKTNAVSDRQAWYKFCQYYGYKNRDFKVIGKTPVTKSQEQLMFNI